MGAVIGISPALLAAATAVPDFRLGTVGGYDHPTKGYQEFVYGRANGAVTGAGFVCLEVTGFDFVMATVTTSAPGSSGPGSRAAVAQAAMADNEYGWFQIYGKGTVRTSASAAKGTQLNTTATGGQLDDDATAGAEVINGVVLLTASGGAAESNTDAVLTYPSVGRTL
jgi:hypothetical protein